MFETLRDLWHASPFRPFTIHLADGRKFEVPHPDFFLLSPKAGIVVVVQPEDRVNHISGRAIVSISQQGQQVAP